MHYNRRFDDCIIRIILLRINIDFWPCSLVCFARREDVSALQNLLLCTALVHFRTVVTNKFSQLAQIWLYLSICWAATTYYHCCHCCHMERIRTPKETFLAGTIYIYTLYIYYSIYMNIAGGHIESHILRFYVVHAGIIMILNEYFVGILMRWMCTTKGQMNREGLLLRT